MVQRDLVKVALGVVVGAALVAAVGVALGVIPSRGQKTTEVTLSSEGQNGPCGLGKATLVRVGKSKHLVWDVTNYCTDGPKTVSVGNFSRTAPGTDKPLNCDNPGPDYPFAAENPNPPRSVEIPAAEINSDGSIDPKEGEIKLKVKSRGELGQEEILYYFDVCLNGEAKDPKLVIER